MSLYSEYFACRRSVEDIRNDFPQAFEGNYSKTPKQWSGHSRVVFLVLKITSSALEMRFCGINCKLNLLKIFDRVTVKVAERDCVGEISGLDSELATEHASMAAMKEHCIGCFSFQYIFF